MKKTKISLVKFTVVAAMIGVFSPSVSVQTNVQSSHTSAYSVLPSHLSVSLFNTAEARRGGGGGALGVVHIVEVQDQDLQQDLQQDRIEM